MYLVLDILPTGEPNHDLPLDAPSQPRPIHLDVLCLDMDLNPMASLSAYVRPDDWQIPSTAPVKHRVAQQNAIASQCLLPILTGPGGAMSTSRYVITYDFERLDFIMKCWRTLLGKGPEWVPMKRQTISLKTGAEALYEQDPDGQHGGLPGHLGQAMTQPTLRADRLLQTYRILTDKRIIARAA